MSKWGLSSLLMVVGSITLFFITRGPNADIYTMIIILSTFSLIGLICAAISKNKWWMLAGMGLNIAVLGFAFLLLLAMGISEP